MLTTAIAAIEAAIGNPYEAAALMAFAADMLKTEALLHRIPKASLVVWKQSIELRDIELPGN